MRNRENPGRLRRELRFSKFLVEKNLAERNLSLEQVKPLVDAFMHFDGFLGLQGSELILLEHALGIRSGIPAVTLVGELISVKQVPAGTGVSYGYLSKTHENTNLGLIGLGFSDGFPRNSSESLIVTIDDKPYPAIGRIAMDQFVVNLGVDFPEIGVEAILFSDLYSLKSLSADTGFTELEILGRIAKRVTRRWSE